ncbi:MAG: adenosylcobalamin-dependent ribonucleoside-diphosphate reductase [Bdellovibrionales bacterium]|nr:adenosylcobalamin-dependent ribonucleoside-diphosphate reductase [Bdellovibrionales bacterium]
MAKRRPPIFLSENARVVLAERYLGKNALGQVIETFDALFERVADAIAEAEPKRQRARWADAFARLLLSLRFLPNSPTLMNAGHRGGQLSACFVLPVEDRLDAIFDSLKHAALIHQSGGGTGFAFSRLRAQGSPVGHFRGVASGPVSFIRVFDAATEIIKQGGTRRGANMAVLRSDHPDILSFIDAKRDGRSILNFNLSVGATDAFMGAVTRDEPLELRDPESGRISGRPPAREIFDRVCESAWACGDPGLVFLDRMNRFNPTPFLGAMESTNPCGEQPLLPYESCNLGSLDLARYWDEGTSVDWALLREDIQVAVRFLDNVIEINEFPLAECREITLSNRKIGLGVMGFADLLIHLRVPYDSEEGRAWGERLMAFVTREARRASARLAIERGAFPSLSRSMWKRLGYPALRNATVSTVAPTGSISMIAGTSSGIEPVFSGVFFRNVLSGKRLVDVHPAARRWLGEGAGLSGAGAVHALLREKLGAVWKVAAEISVEDHIGMQAVFQRHSDSAVSKTINLPEAATVEDVREAFLRAYAAGCKGITVYRDKSRETQVLESAAAVCQRC